jgi:ATP-binding cassette subfamily F protein 3
VNPPNLLLLDEPTTHLDLAGREALEEALRSYGGTVCLVSHDISFVRNTANGIVSIGAEGVRRWLGGYDDFLSQSGGTVAAKGSAPVSAKPSVKPDGKKRKEAQKEIRRLESRMGKLEARIEELEALQTTGLEALNQGTVTDFAEHQKKLSVVAAEIQKATREWIEHGETLETLQQEL